MYHHAHTYDFSEYIYFINTRPYGLYKVNKFTGGRAQLVKKPLDKQKMFGVRACAPANQLTSSKPGVLTHLRFLRLVVISNS